MEKYLVTGTTAHGKGAKSAVTNLQSYEGEMVEVRMDGENFAGTLESVEERMLNGVVVGAKVVIDKRRLGGTVSISTFFKDDDFESGDYIKPF